MNSLDIQSSIKAFEQLGLQLRDTNNKNFIDQISLKAYQSNTWFTKSSCLRAIQSIATNYLSAKHLHEVPDKYSFQSTTPKQIGVVAAGNIPLVCFHDVLCILLSGHKLLLKTSSQDFVLIQEIINLIIEIEPRFNNYISISERLNVADAIIATGSNNSARYFNYYFANKPHIFRKNRTSVALLTGNETTTELAALGSDMLQYFGLGCRNVAKIYVPIHYDFTHFFESIEHLSPIINHHKYLNNYEYNKSILLVNKVPHYDNGFLLLTASESMISPISVIFYETYNNIEILKTELMNKKNTEIQCLIGSGIGLLPFGSSQEPSLFDFADGIDTFSFLANL